MFLRSRTSGNLRKKPIASRGDHSGGSAAGQSTRSFA